MYFLGMQLLFSYGRVDRWEVITPDKYILKNLQKKTLITTPTV